MALSRAALFDIHQRLRSETVTFSGFTEGSNTGDALDTTNGHKFLIGVTRIHGTSHYLVSALQ